MESPRPDSFRRALPALFVVLMFASCTVALLPSDDSCAGDDPLFTETSVLGGSYIEYTDDIPYSKEIMIGLIIFGTLAGIAGLLINRRKE